MKVLVLGHMGMLGSDIVLRLGLSYDVVGKDIEEFDITSLDDCRRVVNEVSPDVVINTTGFTDVDGCESKQEQCFSVNAEGVKNLAITCRDEDIKVVHFSTDYVFDGSKGEPYTEDDPCKPINTYGQSKLQGERYLQEYAKNYLLIRTAWLYGKHGKNFVNTIIKKAEDEGALRVVDDQVGSPTYTVDLSAAVHLLIEGNYSGVYHVTNRGNCSWYEFAVKILEYANIGDIAVEPVTSNTFKRPAKRPHQSVLGCGKFTRTTQKTMRFWQIALKDYVNRLNC